jgi:hypothetical protein
VISLPMAEAVLQARQVAVKETLGLKHGKNPVNLIYSKIYIIVIIFSNEKSQKV